MEKLLRNIENRGGIMIKVYKYTKIIYKTIGEVTFEELTAGQMSFCSYEAFKQTIKKWDKQNYKLKITDRQNDYNRE